MWRSGGIRIARIGGISLEIHLTFALAIAWGAWQGWMWYGSLPGIAYGILAVALLFLCVLAHELGHGLQARLFGLSVRRIILLPVGGLAEMASPPAYPWHELLIALAGPMTNLFVMGALAAILSTQMSLDIHGWAQYLLLPLSPDLTNILSYLLWVNAALFFFNMLPAFPMDGGHIIRSAFAIWTDYELGTRIAAWLGQLLALALLAATAVGWLTQWFRINPVFLMLAGVVYFGARHEDLLVRRQRALVRVEAGSVCQPPAMTLAPWEGVTKGLVAQLLETGLTVPVMVSDRVVGLLTYHDVHRRKKLAYPVTVAHVMQTDFPTVAPHDTLWVALQEMARAQTDIVPVVWGSTFMGIVRLSDVENAWRFARRRQKRAPFVSIFSGDGVR